MRTTPPRAPARLNRPTTWSFAECCLCLGYSGNWPRSKRRSRNLATVRHCRRVPACVYPAIRDGWPADARKQIGLAGVLTRRHRQRRPQSSSASRVTASHTGFFIFTQSGDDRYDRTSPFASRRCLRAPVCTRGGTPSRRRRAPGAGCSACPAAGTDHRPLSCRPSNRHHRAPHGSIAVGEARAAIRHLNRSPKTWDTDPRPDEPNPPSPAGTTADMILRHDADGLYEIYDIGNNTILAANFLGQVGTDFQFAGLGSFFGSDTTDMLLRSATTGQFEVYDISNNNITNAAALGTVGLDFQLAGFGDFNRDGSTDMILRNKNTGQFEVYDIRNNAITSASNLGTIGLNFQLAGFGDFNADGTSDMMLRSTANGQFELYDIVNNQITSAFNIGTVGLDFA